MRAGCRIKSYRMKSGGAPVRVLISRKQEEHDATVRAFLADARACVEIHPGLVSGYVLLLIGQLGEGDTGEMYAGPACPLSKAELPDFTRASMRRRLGRQDAADIINSALSDEDDGDPSG